MGPRRDAALPRVGGAGFGKNSSSTTTGFSDSIRLGEIARVQQNNEIVMRVRLEPDNREKVRNIKWRGVALDTFDNRGWRRSKTHRRFSREGREKSMTVR